MHDNKMMKEVFQSCLLLKGLQVFTSICEI